MNRSKYSGTGKYAEKRDEELDEKPRFDFYRHTMKLLPIVLGATIVYYFVMEYIS